MWESTTLSRERVRVLIVEDNPDQRDLLRLHFEIAGCDVTVAESAETAIVAYQGTELDLAVIDLMLPGMDGWALSKRINSDHPDCSVAISSVLDPDDYPVSNAVLPKPVTRASVRDVLLNCVPGWVAP
jgi:CheY-like chemotaxis protein